MDADSDGQFDVVEFVTAIVKVYHDGLLNEDGSTHVATAGAGHALPENRNDKEQGKGEQVPSLNELGDRVGDTDRHERLAKLSTETRGGAVDGAGEVGAVDTQDDNAGVTDDPTMLDNPMNVSRGKAAASDSAADHPGAAVGSDRGDRGISSERQNPLHSSSTTKQDPVQDIDSLGNSTMSTADLRHGSKTSRQHAVDFATNIFAAVDKNGDGTLTKTEIRKYFKANPEDKYVKANRERPR